jgi:DNA polymerase elongation subunit (family B)
MKKHLFLRSEYDYKNNWIYLYGRDMKTAETKTFIIDDFLAYFYVQEDVEVPYHPNTIATKPGYNALMGERVKKIIMLSPGDVGRFKGKFVQSWESDVKFEQRFLIDLGIKFFFYVPEGKTRLSYKDIDVRLKQDESGLDDGRDIVKYRYLYFDIEVRVKDDGRMAHIQNADEPIISLGFTTKTHKRRMALIQHRNESKRVEQKNGLVVSYYNNEKDMLKAFFDMIEKIDPDVLTGWFVDFDVNYTINRCRTLKIESQFSRNPFKDISEAYDYKGVEREARDRVKGRMVFDLKKGYQRIANTTQNSLNDALINEGFEAKHGKAYEVTEYWENDREKLLEYNDYDVHALKILDEKVHITQFFELVRKISGLNGYDMCLYPQVATDPIALRLSRNEGIVMPNRGTKIKGEKYEGAVVFDPIKGFHKWIFILDLRRFYPSIFMSLNLSRETICEDGDIDCGNFRTKSEPVGLTTKIYMQFWKMRERIERSLSAKIPGTDKFVLTPGSPEHTVAKKSKEAIKGFSNAIYGMTGYSGARLYERRVAEKITEVAREIITLVKDVVDKEFTNEAQVIYGDTDSVFVKSLIHSELDVLQLTERIEDKCNEIIRNFIKDKYNAEPHEFVGLGVEKILKSIILLAKKKYAGKVWWEKGERVDYTYIKGLEAKRRDSADVTGNLQRDVLTKILDEHPHEEIISYVNDIVKQMKKSEFKIDEIAIPKGIRKPLEEYSGKKKDGSKKTAPAQIRGALYANKHFGTTFGQGSKVMMLYVANVDGYPPTEVVCFDRETKLPELNVRKDLMIEKIVEAKIKDIIDVVGISWKTCVIGGTLADYY